MRDLKQGFGYQRLRPHAGRGRDRLRSQVTSVGGSALGYDGRQNITSAPTGNYAYNANNELISATVGASTVAFAYDPGGRLHQAGTTRFLYDGHQAIGEYDAGGALLRRYVPGLGLDDVATAYEGSGFDRRWHYADERGSVVSITDGSGGALAINTYDEYGVPDAGNIGLLQYTGQMWLPQAQLYHYRARAYAPQLGRFMQTDPIGYAAGANLYAYVGGDPVNWTDPFGADKVNIGGLTYSVCVEQPAFPDGTKGWWDTQTVTVCYTFTRSGLPSFGTGGIGSGALRGGGIGGFFPGAGFKGPPIQSDPQYQPYNEARERALHENRWMIVPVIAPAVAVVAPGAVVGGARLAGPSGPLIGRTRLGGSSLFGINSNNALRIGWGWRGSGSQGQHIIRISGNWLDRITGKPRSHIDFW